MHAYFFNLAWFDLVVDFPYPKISYWFKFQMFPSLLDTGMKIFTYVF